MFVTAVTDLKEFQCFKQSAGSYKPLNFLHIKTVMHCCMIESQNCNTTVGT